MYIKALTLFGVGVIETLITYLELRAFKRNKVLVCGVISVLQIFLWYYVIRLVVEDSFPLYAVTAYALGCAGGSMLGMVKEATIRRWVKKLGWSLLDWESKRLKA